MLQWLQAPSGMRQAGQMPPTMGSVATGVFQAGDRVLIQLIGPLAPVVRGTILDVSIEFPGLFQVIPDYATSTIDTLFVDASQLRFEGGQTLLATGTDAASFEASASASTVTLSIGDTGVLIIEGVGLGLLGNTPFVRTKIAEQLVPTGLVISGIHGEGFNKFVVNWEVPQESFAQATMGIIPAVIVIAVAAIAIIIALGWFSTQISLFLHGSPAIPGQAPVKLAPGTIVPATIGGRPVIVVDGEGNLLLPGTVVPPVKSPGADSHSLGTPEISAKPGLTTGSTGWIIFAILGLVAMNTFQKGRS